MKIGFIGAGKAGYSLGKYFTEHHLEVVGYFSKHPASAADAAEFTSSKCFESLEEITGESDVLFLTVPDGEIQSVWEKIRQFPLQQKIICHCSGSLSSAVFSEIDHMGAYGYSIHPLFAICSKYRSYKELSHAYFTIEGTKEQLSVMKELLESCGNPVIVMDAEDKTKYHAAAATASNLVIGLISFAAELLESYGFSGEQALKALEPLVQGNLDNLFANGWKESLTGPVERNDTGTVAGHLSVLTGSDRELYRILSGKILKIAEKKHEDRDYEGMEELLS